MKKYKVILISGGFDPVHKGHIECIQKAFMKDNERKFIMENIKGVDYVYVMNPRLDNDITAIDFIDHSVRKYKSEFGKWEEKNMAFGNGGDRVQGSAPSVEEEVCKSWGIDLVWGLGDKVQSSSWLLEKYLNIAE